MKQIAVGFDKITKIAHIADIHIRNVKRHKEYKKVFTKLYKDLKATLPKEGGLIYLAGDIVHAKTEMSPELISMTSELFTKLSKIAPTILIAGNHDCNLNNKHRLDALTPIVNSLQLDNFYYLYDTDIYEIADCYFVVESVFDNPEKYIKADQVPDDKTKIVLYHGPVTSARTDVGYELQGDLSVDDFEGFDYAMLGDIHKHQYLDKKKTIAYASSLVCQNFGEHPTNHGWILWDLETKNSEFRYIENDNAYYTLLVNGGVAENYEGMPKQPRLRIKAANSSQADIKKVLATLKKDRRISDVTVIRTDSLRDQKANDRESRHNAIGNVRDVNYQNSLIKEYLDRNFNVDDDIVKHIRKINKDLNSQLSQLEVTRDIDWQIKKFEFSNMFSYGANNVVDFNDFKGTYGIFAANASGKSALLDSLCYCLFDRCSRASDAKGVMNNTKNDFYCKAELEVSGQTFVIERKARRTTKGYLKGRISVTTNFWTYDENEEQISLNGEQRRDTNKAIQSYLGKYEDFILTSISVQNNNTGFIDLSQSQRKDLLAQFLDVTVFEELYDLAIQDIKEVQILLKDFKKQDYDDQLSQAVKSFDENTKLFKSITKEKNVLVKRQTALESKIRKENQKYKQIPDTGDIDSLKRKQEFLTQDIQAIEVRLKNDEKEAVANNKLIDDTMSILKSINEDTVNGDYELLQKTTSTRSDKSHELEKLKIVVRHKLEKLRHLEKHEYDPNCNFCMNNSFVKDAQETTKELEKDKVIVRRLLDKISDQDNLIKTLDKAKEKFEFMILQQTVLSKAQQEKATGRVLYYEAKEKLEAKQSLLEQVNSKISEYHTAKKDIIYNEKVTERITVAEDDKLHVSNMITIHSDELMDIHSAVRVAESTKQSITDKMQQADEMEEKYKAYEYYLDAIQRDGVPYELISKVIPLIEDEVNNILGQIVEFNILFHVDGKNINTHIVYDDKSWPLELTSGMEKFISSLAIRSALVSVSNLPKPNFLAIDEGLGNLDSENLNSMFMLFDYLKTQFDFLLIISHLEAVRDVVDNLIDIKKVNNYSKIQY
jgi:DNA repair exonuclease SbcCD ATPase subunit